VWFVLEEVVVLHQVINIGMDLIIMVVLVVLVEV
jgi:hypothetical protein